MGLEQSLTSPPAQDWPAPSVSSTVKYSKVCVTPTGPGGGWEGFTVQVAQPEPRSLLQQQVPLCPAQQVIQAPSPQTEPSSSSLPCRTTL
jgi:PhoPQ-activated pathogenicity-related protein